MAGVSETALESTTLETAEPNLDAIDVPDTGTEITEPTTIEFHFTDCFTGEMAPHECLDKISSGQTDTEETGAPQRLIELDATQAESAFYAMGESEQLMLLEKVWQQMQGRNDAELAAKICEGLHVMAQGEFTQSANVQEVALEMFLNLAEASERDSLIREFFSKGDLDLVRQVIAYLERNNISPTISDDEWAAISLQSGKSGDAERLQVLLTFSHGMTTEEFQAASSRLQPLAARLGEFAVPGVNRLALRGEFRQELEDLSATDRQVFFHLAGQAMKTLPAADEALARAELAQIDPHLHLANLEWIRTPSFKSSFRDEFSRIYRDALGSDFSAREGFVRKTLDLVAGEKIPGYQLGWMLKVLDVQDPDSDLQNFLRAQYNVNYDSQNLPIGSFILGGDVLNNTDESLKQDARARVVLLTALSEGNADQAVQLAKELFDKTADHAYGNHLLNALAAVYADQVDDLSAHDLDRSALGWKKFVFTTKILGELQKTRPEKPCTEELQAVLKKDVVPYLVRETRLPEDYEKFLENYYSDSSWSSVSHVFNNLGAWGIDALTPDLCDEKTATPEALKKMYLLLSIAEDQQLANRRSAAVRELSLHFKPAADVLMTGLQWNVAGQLCNTTGAGCADTWADIGKIYDEAAASGATDYALAISALLSGRAVNPATLPALSSAEPVVDPSCIPDLVMAAVATESVPEPTPEPAPVPQPAPEPVRESAPVAQPSIIVQAAPVQTPTVIAIGGSATEEKKVKRAGHFVASGLGFAAAVPLGYFAWENWQQGNDYLLLETQYANAPDTPETQAEELTRDEQYLDWQNEKHKSYLKSGLFTIGAGTAFGFAMYELIRGATKENRNSQGSAPGIMVIPAPSGGTVQLQGTF